MDLSVPNNMGSNWNPFNKKRSAVDLREGGGGQGDGASGADSQPNSHPSSAVASPAHLRKGINLLPEVVSMCYWLSGSVTVLGLDF